MPRYEVIVEETVLVTWSVEAKDAEEAEDCFSDGEITYQEQIEAEVIKVREESSQ